MKCVSYTRLVSGGLNQLKSYGDILGLEVPQISKPIAEQNELIANYAKQFHWNISKKYTDRKEDPEDETSFLQLREDGISRKYDLVVFWSTLFFGRNISSADDFLRDILTPAGIHFAVVEDDFCSIGKTREEIISYLDESRSRFRKAQHSRMCSKYTESCKYKYFGYIWQPDGSLILNEEAAATVRLIFKLAGEGELLKNIAAHLNSKKIETPMQYRARMTGRTNKFVGHPWKTCTVRSLMDKGFYTGKWIRKIQKKNVPCVCPTIIPQEEYDRVMTLVNARSNGGAAKHERCKAYFSKLIYDADTGEKLRANNKLTGGVEIYCPDTNIRAIVIDGGQHIKAQTVLEEVLESVNQEKAAAFHAIQYINSTEGQLHADQLKEEVRKRMLLIFEAMVVAEEKLQMDEQNQSALDRLNDLQKQMEAEELQMQQLEKRFSESNPWIRLYADYETPEKYTPLFFEKYIQRIEVENFVKVSVMLYEQDWKIVPLDNREEGMQHG